MGNCTFSVEWPSWSAESHSLTLLPSKNLLGIFKTRASGTIKNAPSLVLQYMSFSNATLKSMCPSVYSFKRYQQWALLMCLPLEKRQFETCFSTKRVKLFQSPESSTLKTRYLKQVTLALNEHFVKVLNLSTSELQSLTEYF